MNERSVLAIDPGSAKCGLALVRRDSAGALSILFRAICPPDQIAEKLEEAREISRFEMVVVGSGTKSRDLVHSVREWMPSVGILLVDEKDTSLHARERYWETHKRRGWRRILPSTLQVPPEPVDDFVAVILAERVLEH